MNIPTQELATKINQEHAACCQAASDALEHGIRCGELLQEAKANCQQGEWLGWLEQYFEGSRRTVQVYIRLASNREAVTSNAQKSAHLSLKGALELLNLPNSTTRPKMMKLPPHDCSQAIFQKTKEKADDYLQQASDWLDDAPEDLAALKSAIEDLALIRNWFAEEYLRAGRKLSQLLRAVELEGAV